MATERTFIAVKPDGVQRGLVCAFNIWWWLVFYLVGSFLCLQVGAIISKFEQKGFQLVALKAVQPSKQV